MRRLTRVTRLTRGLTRLALSGVLILAAAGHQARAQSFELVSAQVVTHSARPPLLKLSATGPIAFHVLTAAESGTPASPDRLVARLYGVSPGDLRAATNLAPFGLSIQAIDHDAMITVSATGLAADATLVLRAGMRANELLISIVDRP